MLLCLGTSEYWKLFFNQFTCKIQKKSNVLIIEDTYCGAIIGSGSGLGLGLGLGFRYLGLFIVDPKTNLSRRDITNGG